MVAFDAAGPSSAGTGQSTSPITWTHVNNGNGILIGVTIFGGSTNTVTACTYAGVTIPLVKFQTSGAGANGGGALYGLVGPTCPTGSNTVSMSWTDTATNHNCGSVSVTGAGAIGTPVSSAVITNANCSQAVTATTNGGLVISLVAQGSGTTFTASAPNIKRVEHLASASSSADNLGLGTDPSTGGTVTPAWNSSSDDWAIIAVEILPGGVGMAQAREHAGRRKGRRHGAQRSWQQASFSTPDTLNPWQVVMGGQRGPAVADSTRATYT